MQVYVRRAMKACLDRHAGRIRLYGKINRAQPQRIHDHRNRAKTHRLRSCLLDGIGYREQANNLLLDNHEHDGPIRQSDPPLRAERRADGHISCYTSLPCHLKSWANIS